MMDESHELLEQCRTPSPIQKDEVISEPQIMRYPSSQYNQNASDPNTSFENMPPGEHRSKHRSHHDHLSRHKRHRHSRRHLKELEDKDLDEEDENRISSSGEDKVSKEKNGTEDMEDGEILEDGEIASDIGEEENNFSERLAVEAEDDENPSCGNSEGNNAIEEENEESKIKERMRHERKKKQKKEKRRKIKEDKKKKQRRQIGYIDHDRVEELGINRWPEYSTGAANEDDADNENYNGRYLNSAHYPSPLHHDPQGSYFFGDSGASPPGLYDSPSDSDDESPSNQPSMTSLVSDEFIDANVAASEKELVKIKSAKSREKRRNRGLKRKGESSRHSEQSKKKPLLEIPMAERPICKFFKEGKCAKGMNCPFNHDFKPKRLEVCRFYLTQTGCGKGEGCIYMHDDYPCKYYHTGATCYSGDNCRFSHDPLTEETSHLLDELFGSKDLENSDIPDRPTKKPSLLGSPPRHVKEAAERAKEIKKIPSLFDIEVFPPGKEPHIPTGFYSEIRSEEKSSPDKNVGVSSSEQERHPVRKGSPSGSSQYSNFSQGFSQGPNQGPGIGQQPGPSLLGSPARNTPMGGSGQGGMMGQNAGMRGPPQGSGMMGTGPQGLPLGRPMMGAQRSIFGMQQGMNQGMQQGMNPGVQQGINPRMQQGMNQGLNAGNQQQGMNPGMQQPMNPGINSGMQQGMNQGMNLGMNQGMNSVMQQGMNPGIQQGLNQQMNPGMQQGMNQGLQQGMNPGMQQGMNQALQLRMQNQGMQGINSAIQQGMRPNMQQGVLQQTVNPNMQQGISTNMKGMNPGMQQGMFPRMQGFGARPGFGNQQTVSSMPPVLNMINALLRGASVTGSFNPSCNQPQPQPQVSAMLQDTDMRMVNNQESKGPGPLSSTVSQESTCPTDQITSSIAVSPSQTNVDGISTVEASSVKNDDEQNNRASPPSSSVVDTVNESPSEVNAISLTNSHKSEEEGSNPATGASNLHPHDEENLNHDEDESESQKGQSDKEGDAEVLLHLPPMQRQLFMRIQQQQLHNQQQQEDSEDETAVSKEIVVDKEENKPNNKMEDDDNWYSSDEDESGKPKSKLSDIIKTITSMPALSALTQSTTNSTPAVNTAPSSASAFSVMQMIQSIRSQAQADKSVLQNPTTSSPSPALATTAASTPVGKQRPADPRLGRTVPALPVSDVHLPVTVPTSLPPLPSLHVDPPVTNAIPVAPVNYQLNPISLSSSKPYHTLPANVDPTDPQHKGDPRVQRHIKLIEERGPEIKNSLPTKPHDPRLARRTSGEGGSSPNPRPQDPRVRRSGPKDPRLQDLRMSGMNMNVSDPRLQNAPRMDPRMQNMQGQDSWVPNSMGGGIGNNMMGPGGMMLNTLGPGGILNTVGPGGMPSLMGPGGMMQSPNMQGGIGPGSRLMLNDPRNGPMRMQGGPVGMPQDLRQGLTGMNQDPRQGLTGMSQDPRQNLLGINQDPRQGPIGMNQDPRQGPIGMNQDPRQGPIGMNQDPRQGPFGIQGGLMGLNQDPRQSLMGMNQDPRAGPLGMNTDPRQGPFVMQQGFMNMQQGPLGAQQSPMGLQQEPRLGPVGMQQEQRQGPMMSLLRSASDSSTVRSVNDPRLMKGEQMSGDPRTSRQPLLPLPSSASEPRFSHQDNIRNSPSSSPCPNDSCMSPPQVDAGLPLSQKLGHLSQIKDSVQISSPVLENSDVNLPNNQIEGEGDVHDSDAALYSLPLGLREPPPKSDSDLGDSGTATNNEDTALSKKKFDYRNDPRFKRKPASESVTSVERTKKFTGQRKSSMEYSSPLGDGDNDSNSESGYNSYKRPPASQTRLNQRERPSIVNLQSELPRQEVQPTNSQASPPHQDIEVIPPNPELPLKDLFKTFDPTASPFC